MKRIFVLSILFLCTSNVFAQFKNDNILYHTVAPKDLCNQLQNEKDFLLLDVRSKPEYDDSINYGLGLGHLQGSKNINVRQLGKRIGELQAYKTKPVYVYCSHSQRSRVASKMLADSGFKNIINVNGGMTAIHQLPDDNCIRKSIVTTQKFSVISAAAVLNKLKAGKDDFFILDVRYDSAYRHMSRDAQDNALGYFKGSTHIALAALETKLSQVPRDKEIIVVDLSDDESTKAAILLTGNGYTKVSVLLEGIDRMLITDKNDLPGLEKYYVSPASYHIISAPEFRRLTETVKDYVLLDIRSEEEFSNKHKDYWRNIGHLVNAKNIPLKNLADGVAVNPGGKPLIIYSFSGGPDAYEAASILSAKGNSNIYVLAGGLFNVRWTAGNIAGNASLANLVTDVPAENQ